MTTRNSTNSENSNGSQFLDYNGLVKFWEGIKQKFDDNAAIINNINDTLDNYGTIHTQFADDLETLLAEMSTLSPLQCEKWSEVEALAKDNNTKLGSIVFLKASDEDHLAGPYMITAVGNEYLINYINLSTSNNTDGCDCETELEALKIDVNTNKSDISDLKDAIENVKSNVSYEILDTIPTTGIQDGTIYFVKDKNTESGDPTYTAYLGVTIGNTVALKPLSNTSIEAIQSISDRVSDVESDINNLTEEINDLKDVFNKEVIINELLSREENSIGSAIAIPESDIIELLKS